MPRAISILASAPWRKQQSFKAGLENAGYSVYNTFLEPIRSDDILVLWNRHAHEDGHAKRYEQAGARVIVAENGYIGTDPDGGKLFALALNYHNGAGKWNVGDPSRWTLELRPWRASGEFILVLPQRGMGPPGVAMPRNWTQTIMQKLKNMTRRPIIMRMHPGQNKNGYDVYPAFEGAHAVVTWGSGAAIKAIHAGIPVFHDFDRWIGADASRRLDTGNIELPFLGDRLPMFQKLAWAQWSLKEIESGEAFRWLLK